MSILEVKNLSVSYVSKTSKVKAVENASFNLSKGELLGIVGESGCGKSITAMSILRLVPSPPGRLVAGTARLDGRNLLAVSESAMRDTRGRDVAMIFQEPGSQTYPAWRASYAARASLHP